ncbi:hypothetical protein Arub01_11720 [Actinomadura rubrobrunea]|uniref:Metalloprotease n=1 Tax=Actinomadura rubrobrunea TaxID=115335 RepID=A0A9W6UUJ7_9ACTN|nr:neutral zinc metallopeptidase [Actinomadura rubrobrunea]GLW62928.1 hypothetical protein Arub01_11720 [Actinomadura rubrobrunea]
MRNARRTFAAAFLAAAALAAAGCTIKIDAPESAAGTASRTATPRASRSPVGTAVNEAEMQHDISAAQRVVDGFWRNHWSEYFTGFYRSPRVRGGYDGDVPASAPTCGGKPAARNNAFYCIPQDYIAWDLNLMRAGYAKGDAWVYMIIAHEWGHAVQARLRSSLVSVQKELQADCLAGAALYGAAERDRTLSIEPGDREEIIDAFKAVGDDTPWTSPGDHGDALQRIEYFSKGRTGGVRACFNRA